MTRKYDILLPELRLSYNWSQNDDICKKMFSEILGADWFLKCIEYMQNLPQNEWYVIEDYIADSISGLNSSRRQQLSDIIKRAPGLPRDTKIYRGFHRDWDTPYVHNFKNIPFLSTTLWKIIAANFAYDPFHENREKVILELTLPAGTSCLWIDKYSDYLEQEVLIPDLDIEIIKLRKETISLSESMTVSSHLLRNSP